MVAADGETAPPTGGGAKRVGVGGKQDKFRAYCWFLQKILIYVNISCFQGLGVYIIILAVRSSKNTNGVP